jgi:hypothetical protein
VERREGACAPPPEGSAEGSKGVVPEGGRERERARRCVKKKNIIILTYGSRFDGRYRVKI